ncbi:type I restriction endonuclease subunit R, partial [candidate division KSB1 bacterium]|nr:type I restriction endonuclease subunit R [candidate division KSB1 bacterium]
MIDTPSFKEDHISQVPALQLLQNLGYVYISPEDALKERRNKLANVLLEDVLEKQLRKLNRIRYKGEEIQYSDNNIHLAIEALKDFPLQDGLIRTNEKVYELLTLGKSFEQNIDGDRKSFDIRYIDWEHPENNVFHVTEEFAVERMGEPGAFRPDIVLFVNGIPLVIIECKRPDKEAMPQAISQHLRNQHEHGIPQLYIYSQMLLSLCTNEAKFGTTGTIGKFWSVWKEQLVTDEAEKKYQANLHQLKNTPLTPEQKDLLFASRFRYVRKYFDAVESEAILPTAQDELLYNICRPERLLEIAYKFLVYDAGEKKITRYQQYFAIQNTIQKIKPKELGKRKGGIIWHTQGSGKSLTMVMLAKSIALEKTIKNPRIVLVTDRVDLDDQIYKTFKQCDMAVIKARSGKHLAKLIDGKDDVIITTVIDKFQNVVKKYKKQNPSSEIFVLVDESHRSQYGEANIMMQKVYPNACYIGFTGTPLMRKDKNTALKFGGFIDKYTIDQAVADKAVLPLLYEGRHVVQEVQSKSIDNYFAKICDGLTKEQQTDLKKKYARADQLNEADKKIYCIAWDISLYFEKEWQGTGFKAQLTTPSKAAALKYKQYLDEIGKVTSEIVISGPDTREGHEDIYDDESSAVLKFWKIMMKKYSNEKEYNTQIIAAFRNREHPEIIIVVDKLLTGFDAPKNVVLFITRSLRDHNLLQAIARVNRLFDGKDFGYILDYYGVLGDLDQALHTYSSLSEFDEEDIAGVLTNIKEEIKKLAERHSHLWDLFRSIKNKKDEEAYEQLLADKQLRDQFYERLSIFARTLKIALSDIDFIDNTPENVIRKYKEDARFFLKLRVSVKKRYSDAIDFKQYEKQIQNLINNHVSAD